MDFFFFKSKIRNISFSGSLLETHKELQAAQFLLKASGSNSSKGLQVRLCNFSFLLFDDSQLPPAPKSAWQGASLSKAPDPGNQTAPLLDVRNAPNSACPERTQHLSPCPNLPCSRYCLSHSGQKSRPQGFDYSLLKPSFLPLQTALSPPVSESQFSTVPH